MSHSVALHSKIEVNNRLQITQPVVYSVRPAILVALLITVTGIATVAVSGTTVAQAEPVQENSVQLGGSTVTIDHGGASSVTVYNFPSGYSLYDFGTGFSPPDRNEILWNSPNLNPVSFTLTPPSTASPGDTVTFLVKVGSQSPQTVTLTVEEEASSPPSGSLPAPFPGDPQQYEAIAGDDTEISTFDLLGGINQWATSSDGSVNGVSFTSYELSSISNWVSESSSPSPAVVEDKIAIDGSTVTIEANSGDSVSVSGLAPETISETGAGVTGPDGILWNRVDDGTVQFKLTPPTSTEPGDTIEFRVYNQPVKLTVTSSDQSSVPADNPLTDQQYRAVDANNDGEITQSEFAEAEQAYRNDGRVNGVMFSRADLVDLEVYLKSTNDSWPDDGSDPGNDDDGEDSSGPVVEDSLKLSGSTVTIEHGGASAVGVSGIPGAYYPPKNIGNGARQQSDNGIIWQGPSGTSVDFTLTPPSTATPGDTVRFDVKVGSQSPQTVTLDVTEVSAPSGFPSEPAKFQAIAGSDGSINTFDLVDAIDGASDDGQYNGVAISTFDFVDIIDWNSGS